MRILKKLAWLLALALVVFAVLGIWRYSASRTASPIEYRTAPAEKRRIVGSVTASGTLSAKVTVQVGSQVSGRVQELHVDFNSPVKKGQLIARIDPLLFQAAVAQASANYQSARAGVTRAEAQGMDAERQFARIRALFAESLVTRTELETSETNALVARAQIAVAKAAFEQAQASLNQANVNLSYTRILSPIDGIVISRNVDVGQTVAASLSAPVLFTIAEDLRSMQLDTNVAEGDIGRLEVGMRANFSVDAFPGQRFRGTVSMIRNAPQTLQNVVTYDAVIAVDNPEGKLRPGMTANVTIFYAQKEDALAVPAAALRFRPPSEAALPSSARARRDRPDGGDGPPSPRGLSDTRRVWVLPQPSGAKDARSPPELRPVDVKAGLSDGNFAEILEGQLHEGDAVVIDSSGGPPARPQSPGGASPLGGSPPSRGMRL